MLTPQDIKDKKFEKALVGGYDMSVVDDFLEALYQDYAALYKDNAVLKSKLKVLVEKVEEYRSTEDSMRMALLTAQKMGAEITEEANKKGDAILAEVNEQAKQRSAELQTELAVEEARLAEAKRETSLFSKRVLTLIEGEKDFIERLEELVIEVPAQQPAAQVVSPPAQAVHVHVEETFTPPAVPEPVAPPIQETPPAPAFTPIVPLAPPTPAPKPEEPAFELPPSAPVSAEPEIPLEPTEESVAAYLAQAVSGMMEAEPLTGTPQTPHSFFDDATAPAPPMETTSYTTAPNYAKSTPGSAEEVEFYKLFDQDPGQPPEASPIDLSIFDEVPASAPAAPVETPPVPPAVPDARAAEKIDIARSISESLGGTEEIKVDVDAFWDDEGPPTTKRPKFDFDNLQFGANYDDE